VILEHPCLSKAQELQVAISGLAEPDTISWKALGIDKGDAKTVEEQNGKKPIKRMKHK
jgi:hypothetical protein